MAKKTTKKVNKIAFEKNLPQNILPVGERVEQDKNIYISQSVYKEIHKFTKNKTTNESGGMLVGNIIEEFGKTNIVIQGFVEAKYAEGTSTTLKFTHETWDYVHEEIDKRFQNGQIVGWIHTHPDFGIFLSEYDKFIQENFFKEEYQIAYVVDPIQHIEGFYFWINGKIERCKGFYIFDKTGEKIEIDEEKEEKNAALAKVTGNGAPSFLTYILGGALIAVIIVFAVVSMNLLNRMKILETQQENLVDSANQSITYLQQQISSLEGEIEDLRNEFDTYHPAEPEPETEVSDEVTFDNTGDNQDESVSEETLTDSTEEQENSSEEETVNE